MNLTLHGFDIGKRIGEANRAAVEKRYAESGADALVFAGLAGECGGELLATGGTLHAGGIGFGVGQNFSRGVDDGGAGAGGLTLLGGDFRERVSVVGFDAVGEEQSFLGEAAFDFGTE